ncbi:hypothetical protein [Bifidobacterium simiarum]|uniref:Uncharacterized protein n=1 Tax=Bifidobacterium simiarum TaxID=2045441 RepID=A0A2M9HDR8_9BIFI|nr:hypothetical protein [Bifidobacterium simiarum]PJM74958.1 hypothetical protein CSQ87_06910 [Bifidobacterium simiarum]
MTIETAIWGYNRNDVDVLLRDLSEKIEQARRRNRQLQQGITQADQTIRDLHAAYPQRRLGFDQDILEQDILDHAMEQTNEQSRQADRSLKTLMDLRSGIVHDEAEAMYALGDGLWKSDRPAESRNAVILFHAAAVRGNADAQYRLGQLYFRLASDCDRQQREILDSFDSGFRNIYEEYNMPAYGHRSEAEWNAFFDRHGDDVRRLESESKHYADIAWEWNEKAERQYHVQALLQHIVGGPTAGDPNGTVPGLHMKHISLYREAAKRSGDKTIQFILSQLLAGEFSPGENDIYQPAESEFSESIHWLCEAARQGQRDARKRAVALYLYGHHDLVDKRTLEQTDRDYRDIAEDILCHFVYRQATNPRIWILRKFGEYPPIFTWYEQQIEDKHTNPVVQEFDALRDEDWFTYHQGLLRHMARYPEYGRDFAFQETLAHALAEGEPADVNRICEDCVSSQPIPCLSGDLDTATMLFHRFVKHRGRVAGQYQTIWDDIDVPVLTDALVELAQQYQMGSR